VGLEEGVPVAVQVRLAVAVGVALGVADGGGGIGWSGELGSPRGAVEAAKKNFTMPSAPPLLR